MKQELPLWPYEHKFPLRGFPPKPSRSLYVKDPCLDLLKVDEELFDLEADTHTEDREAREGPQEEASV